MNMVEHVDSAQRQEMIVEEEAHGLPLLAAPEKGYVGTRTAEDQCFLSGQQRRHVAGPDIVSEAAREDAVGIALHHGGHVTPPHREKERDRSGLSDKT